MTISEIKRKGKSELYYVYVDNAFFGLLQAEFIYKHKIKVGLCIEEKLLFEIKEQSDKLTCFNQALGYVSKMIRSEIQVKNYLKKYGYMDEAIDLAVEKLKNYGYINDEYMALVVAESLKSKKGINSIKKDLMQKGICKEEIYKATNNLQGQEETCKNLAKKWLKTKQLPLCVNDKAKLYRFLCGKGFEFDVIKSVCFNLELGEEDDWD